MSSQQSSDPNTPETADEEVVAHLDMILDPEEVDPEKKKKRAESEPAGEDEFEKKRK